MNASSPSAAYLEAQERLGRLLAVWDAIAFTEQQRAVRGDPVDQATVDGIARKLQVASDMIFGGLGPAWEVTYNPDHCWYTPVLAREPFSQGRKRKWPSNILRGRASDMR